MLAAALAAALLAAPPFTAAATAQDGWLAFDSSEVITEPSDLSFTVKYPPGYEKEFDTGQTGGAMTLSPDRVKAMDSLVIQSFSTGEADGSAVALVLVGQYVDPDDAAKTVGDDPEAFFNTVARASTPDGASLDGVKLQDFRGLRAADMYYSGEQDLGQPEKYKMFVVQRMLLNGSGLLALNCTFLAPETRAAMGGYSSDKNPVSDAVCRPFFDSLRFAGKTP
jgi:hypothetical protein